MPQNFPAVQDPQSLRFPEEPAENEPGGQRIAVFDP